MSIAYVDSQLDAIRAEAKQMQESHSRTIKEISVDPKLSDEGKKAETAQWKAALKERNDTFRNKELAIVDAAIVDRQRQIDSKVGNTASDLIAFRDAQDRAERIENADQAQRVLERALRTSDASLAGAVFRRSLEAGWKSPIDTLTAARPELAEAVTDLRTFAEFRDNKMARTAFYAGY
jgi:hypothetical protein